MTRLWKKISVRLVILTVIVFVPMLAILIVYNIQNMNNATKALIQESQGDLAIAVKQLDNHFEVAEALLKTISNESTLIDTIRNYDETSDLITESQESQYKRAVNLLSQHLSESLLVSESLKYAFIYFPAQDLFYNSKKEANMTDYVYQLIQNEKVSLYKNTWTPVFLINNWYILRIWQYNGYMIGAWFLSDDLLENVHISVNESYDRFFMTNEAGISMNDQGMYINEADIQSGNLYTKDYYKSNGHKENYSEKYYYLRVRSEKSPITLVKLLNVKTIRENSPDIMLAILSMSVGMLILIVLYIVCTRRWLLRPLGRMTDSMNVIRSGDVNYRIDINPAESAEFTSLGGLFNEMMDQVNTLKNEIYEGRLERQEIRLEYLQKQIQPHFILNTLNTLYNHTEDEVQKEIILLMTRYYRFVVNADSKYVQLGQELEHIENYLKLQQVRYPNAFEYRIICEDALEIIPVPPFLIESFVGNTIKHVLNVVDCVLIRIEVISLDKFTTRIRISDNGPGFEDEVLDMIQEYLENKTVDEELGVGIRNSIERLKIIYGEQARIKIYNDDDGGAVIEIDLALQTANE